METAAPNPVLSYTNQPPRPRKGVNVRLIAFLAIVSAPFLAGIGMYINSSLHRGITQQGDVAVVDLKSLGYFPFDQNNGTLSEVPAQWRALDGKRVQLEGFMYSGQSAGGQLSDFQFVYNVQKCCFNGPPLVQERVFAHVPAGRAVPYYGDYCRLTGILHVKVTKDETGGIISLYTLDVEKAELAT